jgi:large subunit ribosomal protein L14e
MFEIGRICVKIAGRDARKKAVIIDVIDKNYVLIDGETRRRKCNINHLEPLNKIVKIKKKASPDIVKGIFKKELNIELSEKKPKIKKEKPKKKPKKQELKKTEKKPDKKEKLNKKSEKQKVKK